MIINGHRLSIPWATSTETVDSEPRTGTGNKLYNLVKRRFDSACSDDAFLNAPIKLHPFLIRSIVT